MFSSKKDYQLSSTKLTEKLKEKHGVVGSDSRKKFLKTIAKKLTEFSSPDAASAALSNVGLKKALENESHKKFGNGFVYVFSQAMQKLSYDEMMQILVLNNDLFRDSVAKVIFYQLQTNPQFKEKFEKDNRWVPLFDTELSNRLKALALQEEPKLVPFCESIKDVKIDQNFAFTTLAKLYNFPSDPDQLSTEQQDLIKVALFLFDTEAVKAQFEVLEKKLQLKLADAHYLDSNNQMKDYQPGAKTSHNKKLHQIFHEVLNEWATENDFKNLAKLFKNLSPDDFFKVLGQEALIIDTTERGSSHGQWAHYFQIMCLAEYNRQHKILSSSPQELLSWIAEQGGELWGKTFDNVNYNDELIRRGFRSPQELTTFLYSKECSERFPCLFQFIQGHERMGKSKSHVGGQTYEISPITYKP